MIVPYTASGLNILKMLQAQAIVIKLIFQFLLLSSFTLLACAYKYAQQQISFDLAIQNWYTPYRSIH